MRMAILSSIELLTRQLFVSKCYRGVVIISFPVQDKRLADRCYLCKVFSVLIVLYFHSYENILSKQKTSMFEGKIKLFINLAQLSQNLFFVNSIFS